MIDKDQNPTGLEDINQFDSHDGTNEWERDILLIHLENRINALKLGAYRSYGRLLLPVAITFPLAGIITFTALNHIRGPRPFWLALTGDVFFVIGIFIAIVLVLLFILDRFRTNYLESLGHDKLAEFRCKFFTSVNSKNSIIPSCTYFHRDLNDTPLCVICPIYEEKPKST